MRVCSLLIHSFSLVWDLSFFLFESVVVLLPSLRPRVLMTRATTAKDDDDDGVVVVIIASSLFLFRLSLSLSRAHRVGGSEKPSRQSPIFEKMRETKAAPKTQRRGSTSASLSHKKRHSRAFALSHHHHRVFSSPTSSFDRHPENPEQKRRTRDGREHAMAHHDQVRHEASLFPLSQGKRSEREIQNCVHFFFSPRIIDSISDAESDRANETERLPRAHTDRVILSFCVFDASQHHQHHSDGVLYSQAMVSPKLNPLINSGTKTWSPPPLEKV